MSTFSRRLFLGFLAPMACAPFVSALSASSREAESRFGKDWRLPANETTEVWVTQSGLDLSGTVKAVADWSIPSTSKLVIRLVDGAHQLFDAVRPQNADGSRLSIIGNTAYPERCRVLWSKPTDAFYVSNGQSIEMVDGLTFQHTQIKNRGLGSAFLADGTSMIRCGPHVAVRDFYYGFQARYGGVISCPGAQAFGAGDACFFAFQGGHIMAEGALAESAYDPGIRLGSGFVAEYGGTINAVKATSRKNYLAGFTALSNGSIRAYDAISEQNQLFGFYTDKGGVIVAHNAQAVSNCEEGVLQKNASASSADMGNKFKSFNNGPQSDFCRKGRQRSRSLSEG